ncbi:Lysine N-acyltransferase MbtK OS=Streptomyces microflavus OX=1919 GN=Smic_32480 PE=3 SV=1 [Streptomyces microflavus]
MTAATPPDPDASTVPALRPAVHEQKVEGFGVVRLVPVVPAADAGLLHAWVTEERARFWGMAHDTREQVQEIYEFVDSLRPTTPTWRSATASRPRSSRRTSRTPTRWASTTTCCRGLGIHLLIAPAEGPVKGYTDALLTAFIGYVFSDPAHLRVVVEPDARNEKALARMVRVEFPAGPGDREAGEDGSAGVPAPGGAGPGLRRTAAGC